MDENATPTRPRTTSDGAAADEEASADLSRAAREAVRQPPDPRIEGFFANLASAPEPARPIRIDRPPAEPVPPAADADSLRDAVEAWRTAADRISRRLEVVSAILVVLTVVLAIAAVLLVTRA